MRGRDGQPVKIATSSATTYYRDTVKVSRHTIRSSGSTSYAKDGQSSNRAAVVTEGAVVRATGTIDANGVDLTASRIDGFTPGQGGGRGAGHGRGPGSP